MFDWLRRRKLETPEEAQAAVLRQVKRLNPPASAGVDAGVAADLFAVNIGPSDGCAAHHSGACHSDPGTGCDFDHSHY